MASNWVIFLIVLVLFPLPSIDIFTESLFQHYRAIQDPYLTIPDPRIVWVDPSSLIRHEYTSRPHLVSLLKYLATLEPGELIPIPVVTLSEPKVILDGHHRVAASRVLGFTSIPVWEVDDDDENLNWNSTLVRCYSRANDDRMPLATVVSSARSGKIDWGIKGTKHVAYIHRKEYDVELELVRVTPRIEWGLWKNPPSDLLSSPQISKGSRG